MNFSFVFNSPKEQEKKKKTDLQAIGEKVTSFFWDVAPEHGFEMREGQQDMSFEIVDALIHDQHFAVEAGVGIGKSFGYLVPVLLYNKKMKKPVIVATSTIALQEQLWDDVHDVMPLLNTDPEVILAKGQTHYLCHKRANEYLSMDGAVIPKELADGIEEGFQERKQFPPFLPQNIWDKVNIQRFSMRNCGPCEKKCLYYAIRSQLRYTDGIVLCNQDFLTAHLRQIRRGQDGLINRDADLIVVDEAHNLDDKVRSATTERINQGKILGLIKSATNEVKPSDRQNVYAEANEAQRAIRTFFDCLKAQVQQQINNAQQDMRYADRFFFDDSAESIDLLRSMVDATKNAALSIQIYASFEYHGRSTAASDDLDELTENLTEMIEELDDYLLWIERKGSQAELVYCPKNTREITKRLYFSGKARTILTSATLTNTTEGSLEDQYAYFISNTGFPTDEHGCLSEPKPSPYPYDEHSMIYYCDDLPHPTKEHEAFIEQGVQRLLEVLDISGGKALVLFTAKSDMEDVYSILSQKELPYKVLMQQSGSSQDQVLKEFRENTNSVLLGTGAYWEGISIEGKSLSNVVIFRLPFPVPDPIINYKASIADDALMDVNVPEMVIKLKQGIGRLIRNFTDTGIVCIIDRRLRDEPAERYHDIAWSSLPIKNRTKSLDELRRFYEGLSSANSETAK
ncbi:ATP-dependent DNA helicase [Flavonifractor plautii]|uniref:ATP-dependent DNA helicase n=1 Tax=Oscillospiraceae TaxID=216572 RepID=UPI001897B3D1|nr:ATP-dependent DNA helicase [Flavonifractor plautii]MDB7910383.1 ATP-dependent DNA helicase [Flavonifractor plautii]MDB7913934.1 ATP-dependent DNA helicase [Flavonifractor plautii]MDS9668867.1 ATP-dependent DNA helicase [Flavonifractor plautii]